MVVSGLGKFGLFNLIDLNWFDWLSKPNDLIGRWKKTQNDLHT